MFSVIQFVQLVVAWLIQKQIWQLWKEATIFRCCVEKTILNGLSTKRSSDIACTTEKTSNISFSLFFVLNIHSAVERCFQMSDSQKKHWEINNTDSIKESNKLLIGLLERTTSDNAGDFSLSVYLYLFLLFKYIPRV